MARSQQSFNKKEVEKKKRKKKLDKEKKREERQSSSEKGKSFDDMMAYVDEHGNITDTPPDPADRKKNEIELDDIMINVPKKEELETVEKVRLGTVTFFNDSKGYGFIKDLNTQESIFVHINGLIDSVKEGNRVSFETERGHKGLNAIKVKLAK
ncbi:MAG: cold shock domain-containing protein [Bacteroidales bacterium]|nr:cold shock domain-containing protein [Bacteroidales bacterium]